MSVRISRRRTGTGVAGVLEIIDPVSTHSWNLLGLGDSLGELCNIGRYILKHPMKETPPGASGSSQICARDFVPGQVDPGQRRGEIQPFASVPGRDGLSLIKTEELMLMLGK